MTKIVYDAVLKERLRDFMEPMELCDESGHVLARVFPVIDPSRYTEIEPRISDDELARRGSNKGKTYTTAEVLAYLERL